MIRSGKIDFKIEKILPDILYENISANAESSSSKEEKVEDVTLVNGKLFGVIEISFNINGSNCFDIILFFFSFFNILSLNIHFDDIHHSRGILIRIR